MIDKSAAIYLDKKLTEFSFSVRVSNCFKEMKLDSIRDLVKHNEAELLKQKNFGRTSLKEVTDFLNGLGLRLGLTDSDIYVLESQTDSINNIVPSGASNCDPDKIYLTFPWMASFSEKLVSKLIAKPDSTVAEALDVNPVYGSDITIVDALRSIGFKFFGEMYDEVLLSLPERQYKIIVKRVHNYSPVTLEDLALKFNITRERVRQLEAKAIARISQSLKSVTTNIQVQALRKILSKIILYDTVRQICKILISSCIHTDQALIALLNLAGPYKSNGDWLFRNDAESADSLKKDLLDKSDRIGRIDGCAIEAIMNGLFWNSEERDRFLADCCGFNVIEGEWVARDSKVIRALLALDKLGRPATKEEIAAVAGLDRPSDAIAQFYRFDFICRADKYRWAFVEWVDDPYDGIVGEIEQRIQEDGGITSVARLIKKLPLQFGISENSVRSYLAAPMFVVSDGYVRLASQEEMDAAYFGNVQDLPNAVRLEDGTWAVCIEIEERFFDGYSAAIPASIAAVGGIKLGESLLVPVEGTEHYVSLIWRISNYLKTVDLGRIEPVLRELNLRSGDQIIVVPARDRVRIYPADKAPIENKCLSCSNLDRKNIDRIIEDIFRR